MTTRRRFFMTSGAVATGAAVGSIPLLAPKKVFGQTPQLSPAVLNGSLGVAQDAYTSVVASVSLAPHLNQLKVTSWFLFAHLRETGTLGPIQSQMANHLMTDVDLNNLATNTQVHTGVVIPTAAMPSILGGSNKAVYGVQVAGHDQMMMNVVKMFNDMSYNRKRMILAQDPIGDDSCWYYGWILFYLGWVAIFSPPPVDAILGAILAIAASAQQIYC